MTPECPGCHAEFQHDNGKSLCKKCGLPDEVIADGQEAVGRWLRREARKGVPAAVEVVHGRSGRGASVSRRRKPHGRAGAVKTRYRA